MDESLISMPVENNGQEGVRRFGDEDQANAPQGQTAMQEAIKLAGVWGDLDADDMLSSLDRLRHESKSTPPIDSR
jgi:hypothetical protein